MFGFTFKNELYLRFLIFQFLIPVIQISLFCLCIGREPYDLNFGIVNNETNFNDSSYFGAKMYVDELSNHTFKKVHFLMLLKNFKLHFLKNFKFQLFKKHYLNWSQAYSETKSGKLWGFIDLSENFTQDTIQKYFFFEL